MTPTDTSDSTLSQLIDALGWQAGTVHQALAEVRRLVAESKPKGELMPRRLPECWNGRCPFTKCREITVTRATAHGVTVTGSVMVTGSGVVTGTVTATGTVSATATGTVTVMGTVAVAELATVLMMGPALAMGSGPVLGMDVAAGSAYSDRISND